MVKFDVEKRWVNANFSLKDLKPNSINEIVINEEIVGFLKKTTDNQLIAFQNKCSHMGDPLVLKEEKLICKTHGWTYNFDGENENRFELGLRILELKVEKNDLYIGVPLRPVINKKERSRPPVLKVHSHACLELSWENFSILTDPWITGDAYYGSWTLWPPPLVKPENLNIDAIVITHPHPDHFHLETLMKFDKRTPIYYPNFISEIIDSGLKKLGFENLHPCNFMEKIDLRENITIEFYKPTSAWEDSIVLFTFDDFTVLNQNDAGAIFDDEKIPRNIDVFACAFDQGASGYPLTWDNLSDSRKKTILHHQKEFTLKRVVDLCNKFEAKFFLPFAGHWRLGLNIHSEYALKIPHTKFHEIEEELLKGSKTRILDLYPGEQTDFINSPVEVKSQREFIERGFLGHEANIPYFQALNSEDYLAINNKLQRLKILKKPFEIEEVLFSVSIGEVFKVDVDFRTKIQSEYIHVSVSVPEYIGRVICDSNMNWDHIAIGYWGKWSRNTPDYPTNFMRALQIGSEFFKRNPRKKSVNPTVERILQYNVAALVEFEPETVRRIFNRYGLPCMGCFYSSGESLESAIERHRLPIGAAEKIVNELKTLMNW
jgi:nitrite reductase/ring-hydroxylating ferredoxin subunit